MEIRSTLVLAVLLVLSGFVHMGVWVALGFLPPIEDMLASQMSEVEMVVLPLPEPEPVVEEEPEELEPEEPEPEIPEPEVIEPPPEPEPPRPRPLPTEEPPPPPDEPPPEPPAAEEAVADFTGETMAADGPGAFVSALGNGSAMQGAIGQPGAQTTGRRRTGTAGGTPGGTGDGPPQQPPVLAASDLSRQAVPPSRRLVEILRRNYPSRARELGIEGDALVRVLVSANGNVRPLSVVSEEYEGFGAACRQSLRQGPPWEPPMDRQGRPAATRLNFRCTFTIR